MLKRRLKKMETALSLALEFASPGLLPALSSLDDAQLDQLKFGLIGFDKSPEATVLQYNAYEQAASGLQRRQVMDLPLFNVVAQCMNNYLVAQRFDDAVEAGQDLDTTLDFTFTLRMKPTPVVLRLLSSPAHSTQYVAIRREP